MKRPTAIEIAPSRWVEIKYKEETTGCAMGEYVLSDQGARIQIKKDLSGMVAFSTLIHELTHAGFCSSGMDELFTLKQEEAVCKMIEQTFAHIFKFDLNNKHIRWAEFD